MYYYFYRILHKASGKYYLGVRHSKVQPEEDPYMGSGTLIRRAVEKYGKEAFVKEVLAQFSSMKEAYEYEKSHITEKELLDSNCYNLKLGGQGGFEGSVYVNKDGVNRRIPPETVKRFLQEGWQKGSVRSQSFKDKAGKHVKGKITITDGKIERRIYPEEIVNYRGWKRGYCEKRLDRMQARIWITNGQEERIVFSESEIPEGWFRGHAEKHKILNRSKHVGKITVTDGLQERRISPKELEQWLKQGWKRGLSDSSKQKKSEALKGRKFSEEHKIHLRKPKNSKKTD